jgi:hypothetical protein
MEGTIKKRSYLLLRPERHLLLLNDGSFAYFQKSNSDIPILKQFLTPQDITRVVQEGKKIELTAKPKLYYFYFANSKLA